MEQQMANEKFAEYKIIQASYDMPTVKVDTPQAIDAFMNDDGGY